MTLSKDRLRTEAPQSGLTPREREALGYIARGCTYGQAARRMGISPATIDTYLQRIREKSGLSTMAELIRLAVSLNL